MARRPTLMYGYALKAVPGQTTAIGSSAASPEASRNVAYGYDIRDEVICEQSLVALSDRPTTVVSDRYGIRRAVPAEWRERLVEAYDQELREWIVVARDGTATGPST